MKKRFCFIFALWFVPVADAGDRITSGMWRWDEMVSEPTELGAVRHVFKGEGADVKFVSMHITTLNPQKSPHPPHVHRGQEEMFVIKSGELEVTIGDESKNLGPGSVAVALAGVPHGVANVSDEPVTYYVLEFQSRTGPVAGRVADNAPSMLIDQNDVAFAANPRGGYRGFFNRSTATLELFELHETTLVNGVQNHPVHTHGAEEMVIMLEGHVNLEINGEAHIGKPGDVFYIATNDPHTLFTLGDTPSRYFAFQWR